MDDIFIYLIDLPPKVDEAVTPCFEGYTVYINRNLSKDRQMMAYVHALKHISRNDFEKLDVQVIESAAHKNSVSDDILKLSQEG